MNLHRLRIHAWLRWDASGFFDWLAQQPWYTQILEDWLTMRPFGPDELGLEVGCGPGRLTAKAQALGLQMTGVDRSAAMVERARHNAPAATFIVGDALELPLPSASVDVAFAASVVNLVPDPQKMVDELARVVRPKGTVSVLFPTPKLTAEASAIARRRHLGGLSAAALGTWATRAPKREPEGIEALFEAAGLQAIRTEWLFDGTVASVTGRQRS